MEKSSASSCINLRYHSFLLKKSISILRFFNFQSFTNIGNKPTNEATKKFTIYFKLNLIKKNVETIKRPDIKAVDGCDNKEKE